MINVNEYITRSREERQAHLVLNEPCCERGGNSTNHKGVLAEFLGSTIPSGRILLCHACSNPKCSNPRHLYWGTDKENILIDSVAKGTHQSPWQRTVDKYGYEEACRINSRSKVGNSHAKGRNVAPKSDEHKKKISDAIKAKHAEGQYYSKKPGRKKKVVDKE